MAPHPSAVHAPAVCTDTYNPPAPNYSSPATSQPQSPPQDPESPGTQGMSECYWAREYCRRMMRSEYTLGIWAVSVDIPLPPPQTQHLPPRPLPYQPPASTLSRLATLSPSQDYPSPPLTPTTPSPSAHSAYRTPPPSRYGRS